MVSLCHHSKLLPLRVLLVTLPRSSTNADHEFFFSFMSCLEDVVLFIVWCFWKNIWFLDLFTIDTGIANEKDWGINLLNESVNESGTNEDGSTWYRESGVDLGDNGYQCRWARMGGQSHDGSSEWKEMVCFLFSEQVPCLWVLSNVVISGEQDWLLWYFTI